MIFPIELAKTGVILCRRGWNGRGMYVQLTAGINGSLLEPFFIIKNTKGTFNTWVPSISDLLADDWEVLEDDEKR